MKIEAETILGRVEWRENDSGFGGLWEGKTQWPDSQTVPFWFDGPEDDPLDLTAPEVGAMFDELQRLISLLKENSAALMQQLAEEEGEIIVEWAEKPLTIAEIVERMRVTHISFGINEITIVVRAEEGERSISEGILADFWVSFDNQGQFDSSVLTH